MNKGHTHSEGHLTVYSIQHSMGTMQQTYAKIN